MDICIQKNTQECHYFKVVAEKLIWTHKLDTAQTESASVFNQASFQVQAQNQKKPSIDDEFYKRWGSVSR